MRSTSRARTWIRSHPTAADGCLALAVLVLVLVVSPPAAADAEQVSLGPGTLLLAIVASMALTLRRRAPVPVWAVTLAAGVGSVITADSLTSAILPGFIALYTLATRSTLLQAASAAAVTAGCLLLVSLTATQSLDGSAYGLVGWSGMAAAVGAAVRSQRQVLAEARDRAVRAERSREEEAQRRVAEERLRIAHELHDVVAHHISVINVQAGVARHLLDVDPSQARASITVIRESSQAVLTELTAILGLLRDPEAHGTRQPAPSLRDATAVIDSMRNAGMRVTWSVNGDPYDLEPLIDLTAYRVVQESLTNAAKHGDGSAEASISYEPDSIRLRISNRVAGDPSADSPTSGYGLIGMRERVASVGGRIVIGGNERRLFVVAAVLPRALP